MTRTYLALPRPPHGPGRIVAADARCVLTLTDYRRDPCAWQAAGAVRADGTLAQLDAPPDVAAAFRSIEPIMPGRMVVWPTS